MPMPEPNAPWPPREHLPAYRDFDVWDAWYSGDLDRLWNVYRPGGRHRPDDRPAYNTRAQHAGGAIGKTARWFLGEPSSGGRSKKLHVPAAGDLATTWADMIFGQAPKVTAENPETSARLDELFDEDTLVQLHEAAQAQGALGGVFVTAGFDKAADNSRPLLYVNHADNAIPRFAGRRLAEVTFHTVLDRRDGDVLRHVEHHQAGVVQHALFLGREHNLGRRVPLTEAPSLAYLVEELDVDGESIPTGLPRLDTVYVKFRATKKWRREGQLRRYGASLFGGIEGLMDALDETWSSWMRDVRLAKARLIVPAGYMENYGPGQGAGFDLDREVYETVNSLTKDHTGMQITPAQFAIRFQEHSGTYQALWERIIGDAGFSAQSFGLTGEVAMTAAESFNRERKTHMTRGGGLRHWTLGIRDLAELLLLIDREEFSSSVPVDEARVEFPPLVADQPRERAETAQLQRTARAASTYTLVKAQHPDWEDEQVRREVVMIERLDPADLDAMLDDPLDQLDADLAERTGPRVPPQLADDDPDDEE